MDWIIEVAPSERDVGALSDASLEAACRAFRLRGVVILRGVLGPEMLDGLAAEFESQFRPLEFDRYEALAARSPPNPVLKVGDRRFDLTLSIKGPFAEPNLLANPIIFAVLRRVLTETIRMAGFTVVVSWPGSRQQKIHRDHPQLFTESHLGTVLPPYAVNVSVPLIDIDAETGPTGLWLGSHLWRDSGAPESQTTPETMVSVPFLRGDCILLDFRLFHSGLANTSRNVRPLLYMAYARRWFYDEANHMNRRSLNMPIEVFEALPEPAREVMLRVHIDAMRSVPRA